MGDENSSTPQKLDLSHEDAMKALSVGTATASATKDGITRTSSIHKLCDDYAAEVYDETNLVEKTWFLNSVGLAKYDEIDKQKNKALFKISISKEECPSSYKQ